MLDSLDEAIKDKNEKDIKKKLNKIINRILELNNENIIIITCRYGYETIVECQNKMYELLSLTKDEINIILKKKGKNNIRFWEIITKSRLEEYLGNVIILNKVIDNYEKYKVGTTTADIYMDICKELVEIETDNINNYKGENISDILEELSLIASSQIFDIDFPSLNFKLNGRNIDVSRKREIAKMPFFKHKNMEFIFQHQKTKEFLVAYFFHKKLSYKELDFEGIKEIFFNSNYLKKDLKDVMNFLIEMEAEEFKNFILEINPMIFIEFSNLDKEIQKKVLGKNIKLLQEKPYYIWSEWEYYRRYSKIDKDLNVSEIFREYKSFDCITEETFYYLMSLLDNNYNDSLSNYIFMILEVRIKKYSQLDEILNGIFIENNDFIMKLDMLLRKESLELEPDLYILPKFLISLSKNKNLNIAHYFINIKSFIFKKIKEEFRIEELIMFFKYCVDIVEFDCRPIVKEVTKEILSRKEFIKNKNRILEIFETYILEKDFISIEALNLLNSKLTTEEKKNYFEKLFQNKKVEFLGFLEKGDINLMEIDSILAKYGIKENVFLYYNVDKYFNNEIFHNKLINEGAYLEEVNRREREENRNFSIKNDEEVILKKNIKKFNLNPSIGLLEEIIQRNILSGSSIPKEIYTKIIEKIPGQINVINGLIENYFLAKKEIDNSFFLYVVKKYFEKLAQKQLDNIIKIELLEKFIKLIINFSEYDNDCNEIIKFLFNERNKKESVKIIKKIFRGKNIKFKKVGQFIEKCIGQFSEKDKKEFFEILEKKCLTSNIENEDKNNIFKIILKNSKKNEEIDKILQLRNINIDYLSSELYLKKRGINNFLKRVNYNENAENYKKIIGMLDSISEIRKYLKEINFNHIKKILVFYDMNYDEGEKNGRDYISNDNEYLINNFIFYKLFDSLRKNNRIDIIERLVKIKFRNKRIINYINFSLKKEKEIENFKDRIKITIQEGKFEKNNYYFNNELFLEDLIIICEHLTEMRSMIVKKCFTEDEINDLIRFGLEMKNYLAYDQRRGGESETGKNPGERDIVIKNNGRIEAIVEALIVDSVESKKIKSHYNKLNEKYDTTGNKINYLLCYYKGSSLNVFYEKYKTESKRLFGNFLKDLSEEKKCKDNIKIGKTNYENKDIYHLIINLI